jgi:predicted nuclease with RNAse H fold
VSVPNPTTLGIDLAAESAKTGACRIRWEPGRAVLEWVRVGRVKEPLSNDDLLALMRETDAVGIDAPFGWPRRFVAAVWEWSSAGGWGEPWDAEARRALRLRATDRWIAARARARAPLSVSADSIGVCAMRACALLQAFNAAKLDRVNGPGFEVYPAGALREWGFDPRGYKQDPKTRERLLDELVSGGWVDTGSWRAELVRTDHALDAFLSAIVARAAATGQVIPVPDDHADDAAVEGWIHLPSVPPHQLVH